MPKWHIGAELAAFAAHHQADLGVGLQLDEAIDHLHAGAFEIARPFDVGLFVEARLQFDQRRHRLAGLGRLDQRLDDRRVLGGAIERLLDGDDFGIGRGLAQELHHHVEALEGMMDEQILGADRRKAIAAEIADAFGKARDIGLELQIRALFDDELPGVADAQQMIDQHQFGALQFLFVGDEAAQILGHRGAAFHMDDRAAAPALEQGFEQAHEVFGFFLDFDVAVAQHAQAAPNP